MKSFFVVFLLFFSAIAAHSHAVTRETRAVWVTTLYGLDWPRAKTAERQKQEFRLMLDSLAKAGINTVLLQTRIRGSVIYPSRIEPWDQAFGGKNPGYDPLQFAIEECHERGMQLHAWIVTMLLAGKRAADPGLPATSQRITDICCEVVSRYDVDGIHLDYLRYPDKEYRLNDDATYRKYGNKQNRSQWQRDNVTRIMRQVHHAVKAIKPWVCVSVSPIGKRADLSRYSSRGWNARDAVKQDVGLWMREGLVDAIFPMMYFRGDQFYPFVLDWREQACGTVVAPGLGVYQMDASRWPLSELECQLLFLRQCGVGQCFFRARHVLDDSKGFYSLLCRHNAAATLPMPVEASSPLPAAPLVPKWQLAGQLRWQRQEGLTYNIYGVAGADTMLVAAAVRADNWRFNPYVALSCRLRFFVRAMDRYGRESR